MTERLLVVDDEQGSCSEISEQLEALGYDVTCMHNSSHALNLLNRTLFDLMLMDINLPGANGCQLVRRIKSNERLRAMPVIVVASQADTDQITRCLEAGAEDYLVEPFAPELLRARVTIVLERQRLKERAEEDSARAQKLADELQQVILPVGIALSAETDFDRLLEQILIEAKIVANADAGTLYLRTDDDKLQFAIVLTDSLGVALGGTTGNPITFPPLPLYGPDGEPNMKNVATSVAVTGLSVKVADVYNAEDFDFTATKKFDELNGYRTKSVLTVPLKNNQDEVIGVLQLINSQDEVTGEVNPFDFLEQLVIETLASQAAVALNNQLTFRRQTELLKLERDVQVGHSIQADFLPKNEELPQREGWEIAACLHPARQVAGDFYDAFEMTHGRIGFLVADVCDKGVGAALFMALMRSLIRAFAQQHHHTLSMMDLLETGEHHDLLAPQEAPPSVGSLALAEAVRLTNDYVAINHGQLGMFATMFFGVLDPETGTVLYINGGHNAPFIVDAQGNIKEQVTQTGPAVGMFAGAKFEIKHTQLELGDSLFAFTDGIPDARSPSNAFFTEQRIVDLLKIPTTSAPELLKRVETAVFEHIAEAAQFDDVTILILRRCLPDEMGT
jgi:sigma-B regulation protein RsbU (phosphoserine phosphatase)